MNVLHSNSPFSLSLSFIHCPAHMHKHTHAHRKSGYLYILAFVYLSAVPACGVTYSRVQNESELEELEAVFSLQLRLVWLCSALLLLQLPADWHPTTTGTHPCTTVAVELVRPPETQPSQIKHGNSLSTFALYFFLTVCLTKFPSSYSAALQPLIFFRSPAVMEEVLIPRISCHSYCGKNHHR